MLWLYFLRQTRHFHIGLSLPSIKPWLWYVFQQSWFLKRWNRRKKNTSNLQWGQSTRYKILKTTLPYIWSGVSCIMLWTILTQHWKISTNVSTKVQNQIQWYSIWSVLFLHKLGDTQKQLDSLKGLLTMTTNIQFLRHIWTERNVCCWLMRSIQVLLIFKTTWHIGQLHLKYIYGRVIFFFTSGLMKMQIRLIQM